jgi:glucokinase
MGASGAAGAPPLAGAVLALDLGGTQVRAAAVLPGGSLVGVRRSRTPVRDGADAIVAACIAALEAARDDLATLPDAPPPVGIGISAPGPVDPLAGAIVDPPNLGPTFRDVPLAPRIEEAIGLPAVLDRDTQVAALAEGRFGAAAGCDDFLYVTVSTGIGGAIVTGGRLVRGPDGTAGELGHLLVDRNGPRCGCGMRGHLEGIASGSGIARRAREAAERGESDLLAELVLTRRSAFGARDVADAEEAGDVVAASIMEDARDAFAISCVSLTNVFNPSLIVVGGSLAAGQGERLLGPARAAIARGAFRRPAARVAIVPAALGDDVGLVGALVLFEERRAGDAGGAAAGPSS